MKRRRWKAIKPLSSRVPWNIHDVMEVLQSNMQALCALVVQTHPLDAELRKFQSQAARVALTNGLAGCKWPKKINTLSQFHL